MKTRIVLAGSAALPAGCFKDFSYKSDVTVPKVKGHLCAMLAGVAFHLWYRDIYRVSHEHVHGLCSHSNLRPISRFIDGVETPFFRCPGCAQTWSEERLDHTGKPSPTGEFVSADMFEDEG